MEMNQIHRVQPFVERMAPFHCAHVIYRKQKAPQSFALSGLMKQPTRVLFNCVEMVYGTLQMPTRLRTVDS